MSVPAAPKGAGPAGRRLWRSVLADFELAEHEMALLRRAVHVTDVCARLQDLVDEQGPMVRDRHGEIRTHPALVELRAQSVLLARLVVALRVPLGDQDDAHQAAASRPQYRGTRGVYAVRDGAA